jgi:hypothetical protein
MGGERENQTVTTVYVHLERARKYRLKREKPIVNVIILCALCFRVVYIMCVQYRSMRTPFIRTYIYVSFAFEIMRDRPKGLYVVLIELYIDKK